MIRTLKLAIVLASIGIVGSVNAGSFDPGDGRNLSEETLKMFELRQAEPLSAEGLAREQAYEAQANRAHRSVDD